MGILILGTFLALALGMGIGTFAAVKLGVHEGIGQVVGVGLVILTAVLVARAQERKRSAPPPQPAVVTVSQPTPSLGAATEAGAPAFLADESAGASGAGTLSGATTFAGGAWSETASPEDQAGDPSDLEEYALAVEAGEGEDLSGETLEANAGAVTATGPGGLLEALE